MSEYQYYEFRAIDSPLTANQRENLDSLSSRARVTSHAATFVYNYGSFHGSTEKLMSDYFDAMVYVSNWGSRCLLFRIPAALMDLKQLGLFIVSEEIDKRTTKDKKHILLEFEFHDDDRADWVDGEGWLDDLIGLREELIRGDLRGLYLAWLKAAENALLMEAIDVDTLEPPVPDGLNDLSPAQQALVDYLEINRAMISIAAQKSKPQQKKDKLEQWIDKLPAPEQRDYLIRLSNGESNLSVLLNRRLLELADSKAQPQHNEENIGRRTISVLVEASKVWNEKKKKEEQHKAKLARLRELEDLASKKDSIWDEIESLLKEKKASTYKNAVNLLIDLHDLAEYQGDLKHFKEQLEDLQKNYDNRPALIRRMKEAKLIF